MWGERDDEVRSVDDGLGQRSSKRPRHPSGPTIVGRRGAGTLIPATAGSTVSTVFHGSSLLVITEKPHDWADDAMES
jgi:hypothetical protein